MIRLFILITLCLTFIANLSNAQEICNNSLDDDGDGFVDCYDNECSYNAACSDFFLGKDPACEIRPDSFPPFQMILKYKSEPGLTHHVSPLIAGDVDNDGIPELVTTYRNANVNASIGAINILQAPATGHILNLDKSINTLPDGFQPSFEDIAMADINKDGCAEVFILTTVSDGNTYRIIAYDCNGNKIWTNPINYSFYPGSMGLADFDGDGAVELYTRTQIFDAHSGTLMGQNNIGGGNLNWGRNSNGPTAVDMLDTHPGLELVAGCRIYFVDINRPLPPPAIPPSTSVLTLAKSRTEYFTRTGRTSGNATSIADFNQDGYLDVLAIGSQGGYDLNTTIFFWDVHNDVVKKYIDLTGTGDYANGWKNGAGRINIADIDGDTLMNAVYVSGKYLYALEEGASGLQLVWRENVIEETSGYTSCTTFDLNGDGKSEIIYRDEDYLYIYNTGPDHVVTRSIPNRCASRTYYETPIVADMDGDGSAEICVTCSTSTSTAGRNLTLFDEAEVRIYTSANAPWMPARKVWNQNGYFVANVNDDLTIPRAQQLHHLIYARNAECRNMGTSRPLNSFLSQFTTLNSFGCPSFPTPNLSIIPASPIQSIDYAPFTCLEDSIQIKLRYTNRGDIAFNNMLQISFYDGDPTVTAPLATLIETQTFIPNMIPGDTITTTVHLKNPGTAFDLYIVLNDNGTTIPLNVNLQPYRIMECDYDNIISGRITPDSAPLIAELIHDNLKCLALPGTPISADNGAARAYVPIGSINDNTNFSFYWSNGLTAKPITSVDYLGATYENLGAGAYTVYAVHKTKDCRSDTVSLTVAEISAPVNVSVIQETQFDNVSNPNGKLKAIVNDINNDGVGDPSSNFYYAWYESPDILTSDTVGVSDTLAGLVAGTYSVLVLDKLSGCYGSASASISFWAGICATPQPTGNQNQSFCSGATIDDLISSGFALKWYTTDVGGQPLERSVPLVNIMHYYATQTLDGCESSTRFMVAVEVKDTPPPVGYLNQAFCSGASVAELIPSPSATILWYATEEGGLPLAGSTILTNAVHYYAAQIINVCESDTRLMVIATVNDTPAPTGNQNPTFCSGATVADLKISSSGSVRWYNTNIDGSPLSGTTSLINEAHYYATQTLNGCESTRRLVVTSHINVTPPPIGESMQVMDHGKKINDVVVQGTALKWYASQYDAETRSNPLNASDLLVNGEHYFVTQTISDCESSTALDIQISIITGVELLENHMEIYPNPVNDLLTVSFDQVIDHVSVMNVFGEKVFTKTVGTHQTILDFSKWKSGIYIIQIKTDQKTVSQKVIKQ